jgi:hypothetical protein
LSFFFSTFAAAQSFMEATAATDIQYQNPPRSYITMASAYYPALNGGSSIQITEDLNMIAVPDISTTESTSKDHGKISNDSLVMPRVFPKRELLYGLSLSAAYQDNVPVSNGTSINSSSMSYLTTPYVGLLGRLKSGTYLVQYTATVAPSVGRERPYNAILHRGSFAVGSRISRRWDWGLNVRGDYGSEAARELAPLTFQLTSDFPTLEKQAAVLAPQLTNITMFNGTGTLTFKRTATQRLVFAVEDTYSGTLDSSGINTIPTTARNDANVVGGSVTYVVDPSLRTSWRTFGNVDRGNGLRPCTTAGFGAGLTRRFSHTVIFDIGGGPQFGSAACGAPQTFDFEAVLGAELRGRYHVYVSGSRHFATVFQTGTTWENTLSVGAAKTIHRAEFGVDLGMVSGSPTAAQPSYEGFVASPHVRMPVTRSVAVSMSYRRFHGSSQSFKNANLNYALVTFEWSPRPFRLR